MVHKPVKPADLPQAAPVFPLTGALLLPGASRPLNIFEPRYVAMVDQMLRTDRLVVLVQPEQADEESPAGNVPVRKVGCLGRLVQFDESDDGRYLIVLEGIVRVNLGDEVDTGHPFRTFEIDAADWAADFDPGRGENAVDRSRFLEMLHGYADYADLDIDWDEIERTGTADLVNMCCMLSPYGPAEKQVLLEADSLKARAETLIALAEFEMARASSGTTLN